MNRKRKLDMNLDKIVNTDHSLCENLSSYIKRNNPGPSVTVSNPILAEKIEPGYLVKLAAEIETADNFVFHAAHGKLKIIQEQMAFLRKQAMQILVETKINSVLHSLPCNFSKKPGHIYSVYQKSDGAYQFSMISPEEWGVSCPHKFIGSFRLESNMTWNPIDEKSLSSALHCWVSNKDRENCDKMLQ